jgi:hypothetical protein
MLAPLVSIYGNRNLVSIKDAPKSCHGAVTGCLVSQIELILRLKKKTGSAAR